MNVHPTDYHSYMGGDKIRSFNIHAVFVIIPWNHILFIFNLHTRVHLYSTRDRVEFIVREIIIYIEEMWIPILVFYFKILHLSLIVLMILLFF
jgi:hypothetical protein